MIPCITCLLPGHGVVVLADDQNALDGCVTASSEQTRPAKHNVLPQHIRLRSVPYGNHQRAIIGDVVLALRRAPKTLQFLDAQVIDVALRRGKATTGAAEGIATMRSGLPVQLAYPISQLYYVMEENETPRVIARKFGLPLADILAANTHLCENEIQSHSKLRKGTEIVLPDFPQATDTEANGTDLVRKGISSSSTATSTITHWDVEYLVQYLHGGVTCGALEWLRPELIFQTRKERTVIPVPVTSVAHADSSSPTKAQLLMSMLDGFSVDRWRMLKVKDSVDG